jgi:hypothetical protein
VLACLRPGTRPSGVENARILPHLRAQWPETPLLVWGASHCATPEVIEGITAIPQTAFVFGRAANAVLLRQAALGLPAACRLPQQRTASARAHGERLLASSRLDEECSSAAASWAPPGRVVLKAAVLAASDKPRCVVTSLTAPAPPMRYVDLYGARGPGDNLLQAVKCALHRDCTSRRPFCSRYRKT